MNPILQKQRLKAQAHEIGQKWRYICKSAITVMLYKVDKEEKVSMRRLPSWISAGVNVCSVALNSRQRDEEKCTGIAVANHRQYELIKAPIENKLIAKKFKAWVLYRFVALEGAAS